MTGSWKRKLGAALYYGVARRLPPSWSGLQVGQTALRRFCGRLMLAECGRDVNIEQGAVFHRSVRLGDRSGIGVNARLYGAVTIGRCVMMGADVTIITRQHRTARTDVPMMDQGFEPERPVVIGDDVWIGDRVTILPGVTVGDGCIIGAGAVVTHDLPPLSVAAGVPARVIRFRDEREGECR